MENTTIEIFKNNGKHAVSANQLYKELGLDITQWKRWYTKNITSNKYSIESVDYEPIAFEASGIGNRVTTDFALTIDFAKKLAMKTNSDKGEKVRDYFIACEKELKSDSRITVLESIVAPLKEGVEILETNVEELNTHVEFLRNNQQDIRECMTNITSLVNNLSKITSAAIDVVATTSNVQRVRQRRTPAFKRTVSANQHEIKYCDQPTEREKINQIVSRYVNHFNLDRQMVWNSLYYQFKKDCHIDIAAQAKSKQESNIAVAERLGLISKLHQVACSLFHIPSRQAANNIRNNNN